MLLLNVHHTAIAVEDLDASLHRFAEQYGVEPIHREIVAEQDVEEAMLAIGGSHVQLIMPLSKSSPVGRFLDRHGEGLHHVAFQVADIEASLEHLRSIGAHLVDEVPRMGGGGHRIAFVHPGAFGRTLIELVEVV